MCLGFISSVWDIFISFMLARDSSWYSDDDFHNKYLVFEADIDSYFFRCIFHSESIFVISPKCIQLMISIFDEYYYGNS